MQIVACDTALNVDHHDHGKIKILTFGLDRNYKKKKNRINHLISSIHLRVFFFLSRMNRKVH